MGYKEEAIGHNAIAAGVQGQRQWTDYKPNFDFPESMMCTSFDWNGPREAYTLATENDFLNGMSMLFGHLLTNRGVMFSDIRTYWSPEAVKRVSGTELSGAAAGGFIHLINSGATTLDATGAMSDKDGKPTIKPFWEMDNKDMEACLKATSWMPADRDYFRGGGYSSHFLTRGGMPMTMLRLNLVAGLGPVLQLAEGWTVELDEKTNDILDKRTDPTWPTTWFAPRPLPTTFNYVNNNRNTTDPLSLCPPPPSVPPPPPFSTTSSKKHLLLWNLREERKDMCSRTSTYIQ